jgi:hypothetical protein
MIDFIVNLALRAVAVHLSQRDAQAVRAKMIAAFAAAICAATFVLYAFDLLHRH